MFRTVLETQWKWTRGFTLVATLAAFTLPLASVAWAVKGPWNATEFIDVMGSVGFVYPLLAAGIGLVVAISAWGHDHRGSHVYALSLPIARWRYALLRMGAGGVFLVPPALAILAGASLVAVSGLVPLGLETYAVAMAMRFGLAAAVAFAIFFAIAASTPRTAGVILGSIAALLVAQYVIVVAGSNADLLSPVGNWLFGQGGALSIFAGRWRLVDV